MTKAQSERLVKAVEEIAKAMRDERLRRKTRAVGYDVAAQPWKTWTYNTPSGAMIV
jgi:hypothetical protein